MVAKGHSKVTKLAAVVLARLSSPEVAAATFHVDRGTVERWQAGGEVPDDTWTAVRDVLLTPGAEMAAKGQTTGLVQTLTAAGISDRNVRYSTLIARREARRAEEQPKPEQPNPVQLAVDALRHDQQRLMADTIDTIEAARLGQPDPPDTGSDADFEAHMLEWIGTISAMSEEQVATRIAELSAERDRIDDEAAAARAPQPPDPPQTAPDPISPLPTPPEPSQPLPAPSWPFGLHVVTPQEANDPFSDRNHPSWRNDDRNR